MKFQGFLKPRASPCLHWYSTEPEVCPLDLAFWSSRFTFCLWYLVSTTTPPLHPPSPCICLVLIKSTSPTWHVESGLQPGLAAWRAFLWVRKGSSDACPCLCVWAGNVASACGNVGSSSVERNRRLFRWAKWVGSFSSFLACRQVVEEMLIGMTLTPSHSPSHSRLVVCPVLWGAEAGGEQRGG